MAEVPDFKKNPPTDFRPVGQLADEEAEAEAAALREALAFHDYRYYVLNQPVIADAVYDRLLQRLKALEGAYPVLRTPDSPTQRVGAEPVSSLAKVRHTTAMLSLEAVLEADAVADFLDFVGRETGESGLTFDLEPKFDGLSVEVVYRGGRFAYGATRGNGEVGEGAYHVCPAGLACPAQLVGRLVHYGARDALDIDHLGEKTARQLVAAGMVADMGDLYGLTPAQLVTLEGFAETSARQLYDVIQTARRVPLDRFLFALGIPHVGRRVARLLADGLGSLEALRAADATTLEALPEIGPEIAAAVVHFFADDANRRVLDKLRTAGVEPLPPGGEGRRPLAGTTFVFTGALADFTRSEAEARVEALGGRATGSVSGETDYLVVGGDPGAKLDEAREEGVTILEEGDFNRLLRQAETGH